MHPPRIIKRPPARPPVQPLGPPLQIEEASAWVHLGEAPPASGAFVPVKFEHLDRSVRAGQAFTFSVTLGAAVPGLPLPPGTPPDVLVWLSVELPDGTVFTEHSLPARISVPLNELTAKIKDVKIHSAPKGCVVWIVAYGGRNHFRGEIIAPVAVQEKT